MLCVEILNCQIFVILFKKAEAKKEIPLPEIEENLNRLVLDGDSARDIDEAIQLLRYYFFKFMANCKLNFKL